MNYRKTIVITVLMLGLSVLSGCMFQKDAVSIDTSSGSAIIDDGSTQSSPVESQGFQSD